MSTTRTSQVLMGMMTLCFAAAAARAAVPYTLAADKVFANQDPLNGTWTPESSAGFGGTVTAGIAHAYQVTGDSKYRLAAEAGTDHIISSLPGGNYYGDEVYALTQVASWQAVPTSSTYYTKARTYFNTFAANYNYNSQTGTNAFLNYNDHAYTVVQSSPATWVMYLSYMTKAAYNVNANDRALYRSRLISTLGTIDDSSGGVWPVAALGAATWALASTDTGLDSTTITGPSAVFNNKHLSDLAGILEGRVFSGLGAPYDNTLATFLTDDNYGGGVLESAFGALGLEASSDPAAINTEVALDALVDSSGNVWYDVGHNYPGDNFYAGLYLMAAPEPGTLGILTLAAGALVLRRKKA